ncbi:MAG TPA: tetratricopeptide repeat protein, partial [Gemmatimonadales bacterium]|nr:tetratricopeptide repeat protein [Gemmatimonadales bacterium]
KAALLALRALVPEWPIGREAYRLARREELPEADALVLLPAAIAGAPDARSVDSLLMLYAATLHRTTACEDAARVHGAVLRRTDDPSLRRIATGGLGECALQLGLDALAAGQGDRAEHWLREAARADSASGVGRRALVALGDLHTAQGDLVGAAMAYQTVINLSEPDDSLRRAAAERLARLGAADVPGAPAGSTVP